MPATPETIERIEKIIYLIRGNKVILDSDLAQMYGVETKQLKRAVRRNSKRFPRDFMLELTKEEYDSLRGFNRTGLISVFNRVNHFKDHDR